MFTCNCDYYHQFGLVCRHWLAIVYKSKEVAAPFNIGMVNKRWINDSKSVYDSIYVKNHDPKLLFDAEKFNDRISEANSLAISSPQSKILCEKIITRNIHKESDAAQCRKELIESFNRNVKRYKALLGRQYETNSIKSVNTFWENLFDKESNCISLVPSKKRKDTTDLMTPASLVIMTKKKRKKYTKKSDKIPNTLFGDENSVSPNDYLFNPAT